MDITSCIYAVVFMAVVGGLMRWCFVGGRTEGSEAAAGAIQRKISNQVVDAVQARRYASDHDLVAQPQAEYLGFLSGLNRAASLAQERMNDGEQTHSTRGTG
jgi:hypothetical protein